MMKLNLCGSLAVAGLLLASMTSCGPKSESAAGIKVTGSDTMVNLAQAWQEAYHKKHSDVQIQVKGGGSGVGIAALCSGKLDIATSSRKMKPKELEQAKANSNKEPKEYVVGLDALAIYVHKDNPIESISIPQLADIYGEEGKAESWSDIAVENTACDNGKIIRITRQNSSGTYMYFKEAVLGEKGEYKQGANTQPGSADVVEIVSKTPCAIGYSGMGYRTDKVKVVKVSKETGEPGIEPTAASATDGTYPIARPLFLYTLGEPTGATKDFIEWILSDEGQKVVTDLGYVPVPKDYVAK